VHLTPILEEIQQATPEGTNTNIPTEVQEPQNQEAETLKEVQLENIRPVAEGNGMKPNWDTKIEPDESQTTISDHPLEGVVEDITGHPE
jgi:hypothetical protein